MPQEVRMGILIALGVFMAIGAGVGWFLMTESHFDQRQTIERLNKLNEFAEQDLKKK